MFTVLEWDLNIFILKVVKRFIEGESPFNVIGGNKLDHLTSLMTQ